MKVHNVAQVIHCDIKPENILVNSKGHLKISDFGISKMLDSKHDKLLRIGGTKLFLPPETWQTEGFEGAPVDIWSLAVTFYLLFYGRFPFPSTDPLAYQALAEKAEVEYGGEMSPQFQNLLEGCLKKNPRERLTLEGLAGHPWITEEGQKPLELVGEAPKIEVSLEEIKKAISKKRVEANIFALAKIKGKLTRTRELKSKKEEERRTLDEF